MLSPYLYSSLQYRCGAITSTQEKAKKSIKEVKGLNKHLVKAVSLMSIVVTNLVEAVSLLSIILFAPRPPISYSRLKIWHIKKDLFWIFQGKIPKIPGWVSPQAQSQDKLSASLVAGGGSCYHVKHL